MQVASTSASVGRGKWRNLEVGGENFKPQSLLLTGRRFRRTGWPFQPFIDTHIPNDYSIGKLRFTFLDIGIRHRKMIHFSIGAANVSKFRTQTLAKHIICEACWKTKWLAINAKLYLIYVFIFFGSQLIRTKKWIVVHVVYLKQHVLIEGSGKECQIFCHTSNKTINDNIPNPPGVLEDNVFW